METKRKEEIQFKYGGEVTKEYLESLGFEVKPYTVHGSFRPRPLPHVFYFTKEYEPGCDMRGTIHVLSGETTMQIWDYREEGDHYPLKSSREFKLNYGAELPVLIKEAEEIAASKKYYDKAIKKEIDDK